MESNFLWCAHTYVTVFPCQLELISVWFVSHLAIQASDMRKTGYPTSQICSMWNQLKKSLFLCCMHIKIKHTVFHYLKEIICSSLQCSPWSWTCQMLILEKLRLRVARAVSGYLERQAHYSKLKIWLVRMLSWNHPHRLSCPCSAFHSTQEQPSCTKLGNKHQHWQHKELQINAL